MTSQNKYEKLLTTPSENIQDYYNAVKYFDYRKDKENSDKIKKLKRELFGTKGRGSNLRKHSETCGACIHKVADNRKYAEHPNKCNNPKSIKHEMNVSHKEYCRHIEAIK